MTTQPGARTLVCEAHDLELDEVSQRLRRGAAIIALQQKPLQLLGYLMRNHDRVVSREELTRAVWQDVRVSEGSLSTAVYEVRRALGDLHAKPPLVATFRARGYRFMAEVRAMAAPVREVPVADDLPLVGRESLLVRIDRALDSVASGARRMLLVQGAAGSGKSVLARELRRRAKRCGFHVYAARGHADPGYPALWCWVQIMREVIEEHGTECVDMIHDRHRLPTLRATAPVSARAPRTPRHSGHAAVQLAETEVAVGPPRPGYVMDRESPQTRFEVFDALTTLLQSVSSVRPIAIVIDDLHLADLASLAYLRFLVRDPRPSKILLVGAYRDDWAVRPSQQRSLIDGLAAEPDVERLSIPALGPDDIRALLAHALGTVPDPDLVARVAADSGGSAHFAAELARGAAVRAAGDLDRAAHAARTPERRTHWAERARDTVRARIARCSPACGRLLHAAAVLGSRAPLWLAREMTRMDPTTAIETLGEASDEGLAALDSGSGEIRFTATVVRDALYRDIELRARLELHLAAASTLMERARRGEVERSADVARHLLLAAPLSDARAALDWSRRGAAHAAAQGDRGAAAALLEEALTALDRWDPPEPQLRATILAQLHTLRPNMT